MPFRPWPYGNSRFAAGVAVLWGRICLSSTLRVAAEHSARTQTHLFDLQWCITNPDWTTEGNRGIFGSEMLSGRYVSSACALLDPSARRIAVHCRRETPRRDVSNVQTPNLPSDQ